MRALQPLLPANPGFRELLRLPGGGVCRTNKGSCSRLSSQQRIPFQAQPFCGNAAGYPFGLTDRFRPGRQGQEIFRVGSVSKAMIGSPSLSKSADSTPKMWLRQAQPPVLTTFETAAFLPIQDIFRTSCKVRLFNSYLSALHHPELSQSSVSVRKGSSPR